MDEEEDLYGIAGNYGIDPEATAAQEDPAADAAGGMQDPGLVMMGMLQRLSGQPTQYAQEIAQRQKIYDASQKQFEEMVRNAYTNVDNRPSKSEMYFKLAQAFLTPGKTGNFTEGLGQAAGVMGQHRAETRKADQAAQQGRLGAETELAKLRMQGQRDDLTTLRALDNAERTDRRALQTKMLEQYIASGKPQSQVGKEAVDAGYVPGTPEYTQFVQERLRQKAENGSLYKEAMLGIAQANLAMRRQNQGRMSSQEMNQAFEVKGKINSGRATEKMLADALKFADNAFAMNDMDKAQYAVMKRLDPKNDKVVSTESLEQLLTESALAGLKAAFGGNPTEGERAIALLTKGLQATSAKSRKALIGQALQMVRDQLKVNEDDLEDIRMGRYRTYVPEPGAAE